MNTASPRAPDGSLLSVLTTPLPSSLLATPLDYLAAEHMRLRAVCTLLRYAGEVSQLDAGHARATTRFITSALPLHRDDEEQDLFPALLRSARRADELAGTIKNLETDHWRLKSLQAELIEALVLEQNRDIIMLSRSTARLLRDFADAERRHVAVENGIVLAIARARINAKGLALIAGSMSARRAALL